MRPLALHSDTEVRSLRTHRATMSALRRVAAAALPATCMTLGLFIAMQAVVAVDDFVLPEVTRHNLVTIMPPPEADSKPIRSMRPQRLDPVSPPPPLPALATIVTAGSVPMGVLVTSAPELSVDVSATSIAPKSIAVIEDRVAVPIAPPVVTYPDIAITRSLEGDCAVRFSVTETGEPFNVTAECTDQVFTREAQRAVSRTKFVPMLKDGQPTIMYNLVYPLEFRISK